MSEVKITPEELAAIDKLVTAWVCELQPAGMLIPPGTEARVAALARLMQHAYATTKKTAAHVAMVIKPTEDFISSHKTGSLQGLPRTRVTAILGFEPNSPGDGEKSTHEWIFYANGIPCAVWDYRGAKYSTFGPPEVFTALFGPAWRAC